MQNWAKRIKFEIFRESNRGMKNIKAKLGLTAYCGMGRLASPFIPCYLLWRVLRRKEDWKRWYERLGFNRHKMRPIGPLIWMHAASVGETMALKPIIDHILAQHINIILTTGTLASAQLVKQWTQGQWTEGQEGKWGNTQLIHAFAPLDISPALRRFLKRWRPDLVIVCESEIWPRRIEMLAGRRIPQLILNAHLSTASFRKWQKYPSIARAIFSKLDHVLCQEQQDFKHYHALGAPHVAICGNLKADVLLPGNTQEIDRYARAIGKRACWAAISTHMGEEIMAAEIHLLLRKRYPDLLTIIVPRHIERTPEIVKALQQHHLKIAFKSRDQHPQPDTDILLGDTVGDMGLYLKLTEIAFVGKSMTQKGGHNPLEPALAGVAVLSGPNIENFKPAYNKLLDNKAAHLAGDATILAGYVHHLLEHPDYRHAMIARGQQTARTMRGVATRCLEEMEPFLKPLILAAKLVQAGEHYDF